MKIVILSGGSGSSAIQRQLHRYLPDAQLTFLVNAYDDGGSTGAVRSLVHCLGPSDIRKVHLLQHELRYGRRSALADLVELRVPTRRSWSFILLTARRQLCSGSFSDCLRAELLPTLDTLEQCVTDDLLPCDTMCIGNLFYAGFAQQADLASGMRRMEGLLGLRAGTVVLNSHERLKLRASCTDGRLLPDEAAISNYWSASPRIATLHFVDSAGLPCRPSVSAEAAHALSSCDLCVVAPGTQLSSIVPTLMTDGLLLPACSYFVMNARDDGGPDRPGCRRHHRLVAASHWPSPTSRRLCRER